MTANDLGALVHRLCIYYERKFPTGETISEWSEDLAGIPADRDFVAWATGTIKQRSETFPKGFPALLRRMWHEWLRDHPERTARGSEGKSCSAKHCEDGLIYVRRMNGETQHMDTAVYRCRECSRASETGLQASTERELATSGLDFDELHGRTQYFVQPAPKRRLLELAETLRGMTGEWEVDANA